MYREGGVEAGNFSYISNPPPSETGIYCMNFLLVKLRDFLKRWGVLLIEGSLEVKLPTIRTDEKQSWAEAERRGE